MGHFQKMYESCIRRVAQPVFAALMQLSTCLSRKCFSERYDYSRLLSKFFHVTAFKQHRC